MQEKQLDFLPPLSKIEQIDFKKITIDFEKWFSENQARIRAENIHKNLTKNFDIDNKSNTFNYLHKTLLDNKKGYKNHKINASEYLEKNLSILDVLKENGINIYEIINANLITPKDKIYTLPRIVFLGKFEFLSLTDQCNLCNLIDFEDFKNIVSFASTSNNDEKSQGSLLNMMRDIKKDYTKLIVVGNATTEIITLEKNEIPVIMESELIKIHPDYPNINKSTSWKNITPII